MEERADPTTASTVDVRMVTLSGMVPRFLLAHPEKHAKT